MDAAILYNLDLLIQKVTFEKPQNWSFKIRSYKKAIGIVKGNLSGFKKKAPADETKAQEYYAGLLKEGGIKNPTKILAKIMDLHIQIKNGTPVNEAIMTEVAEFQESPAAAAVELFSKIYAVGPAKIKELIEKRQIYTIENLQKAVVTEPKLLNAKQKLGLKYYIDLNTRIPRAEITKFKKLVEKIIKTKFDNKIDMTIAGSYRRGVATSGDMDMLISSCHYENEALPLILKELEESGLVKEVLAKGKKKFMGLVQFEGKPVRHLDIVETSQKDYPFAMLYFTGSGPFNIQMRKHALDLGYSINEYNMTLKSDKKKEVPKSEIIKRIGKEEFETENDIFDFVGIPYRVPKKRTTL
jgi:DNA polymerase beta